MKRTAALLGTLLLSGTATAQSKPIVLDTIGIFDTDVRFRLDAWS